MGHKKPILSLVNNMDIREEEVNMFVLKAVKRNQEFQIFESLSKLFSDSKV